MTRTSKQAVLDDLIAAAEAKVAKLQETLQFDCRYVADLRALRDKEVSKSRDTKPAGMEGERTPDVVPGSLVDQISALLREHGKSMRACDIARALQSRGVTTTSKNGLLPMVLSALSRRKQLFRKIKRGTYKLANSEDS